MCGIEHGSKGLLVRIGSSNTFDSEIAESNAEFARSNVTSLTSNRSVTCGSNNHTKATSPFSAVTVVGGKRASRVVVYGIIVDTFRVRRLVEARSNGTQINTR